MDGRVWRLVQDEIYWLERSYVQSDDWDSLRNFIWHNKWTFTFTGVSRPEDYSFLHAHEPAFCTNYLDTMVLHITGVWSCANGILHEYVLLDYLETEETGIDDIKLYTHLFQPCGELWRKRWGCLGLDHQQHLKTHKGSCTWRGTCSHLQYFLETSLSDCSSRFRYDLIRVDY